MSKTVLTYLDIYNIYICIYIYNLIWKWLRYNKIVPENFAVVRLTVGVVLVLLLTVVIKGLFVVSGLICGVVVGKTTGGFVRNGACMRVNFESENKRS